MTLRRLSSAINKPSTNDISIYRMPASLSMQGKGKSHATWIKQLNDPLQVIHPEIEDIIELEKARQWEGLEPIPSEGFSSLPVTQAVGSMITNEYSKGYPDAR
ncbi:hypothetical protein VNO77_34977 [Canavalia gladiata]|uniref:Serine hydroxymethyltransferase-like domain-containing protein n=1 Tax=Canavalia gladiata TaxID=3824 RepID=A0AAN9PXI4_CANGL